MENVEQNSLEAQVEALVTKKLGERLPHVCMTCDFFQFNKEAKAGVARNRYCQFNGNIRFEKNHCLEWVLASDLDKRHPRNITV